MDRSPPLAPDEFALADFMRPLARRWRFLAASALVGVVLTLLATLVWPRAYTAEVTFTPEQSGGGSVIDNALGSLGGGAVGSVVGGSGGLPAALGGSSPAQSPDFFAQLLVSRELMVSTLESSFRDPADPRRERRLVELLKPRGTAPDRRLGNARRLLTRKSAVTVERRSGIVTLRVTLPDARLAADVANRMVELLTVYNLERRQSTSRAQRRFLAARLAQAERELRDAERARTDFLRENRAFQSSPALAERGMRLGRDVAVRQELVGGLRSSYEDARIAEVRDTPVLSIVDHAAPPDRPSSPRPVLFAVVGGVLALGAAAAVTLLAARGERGAAAGPSDRSPDGLHLRGVGAEAPGEPATRSGGRRSAERS